MKYYLLLGLILIAGISQIAADENDNEPVDTIEKNIGDHKESSRTDADAIRREEEAIKLDGLNVAQMKELREKAEKFNFQTEVNRMMKLIINSLYRNKDIFLRELISNASDALDKIRLLSLTDRALLDVEPDLLIRIKADKENKVLHIMDTGIGMTHQDLITNLGTIAKSGTADFLAKMNDASKADGQDLNDMIGQFGVGFYSAFLVADRVVVTTKAKDDKQYIWESDANSFTISEDPRGDTLKRGSIISLYLKDNSLDFLEEDTVRDLIRKYSQFINFPIYMWGSRTETEEVPVDADTVEKSNKDEDDAEDGEEDTDAKVEEDTEEEKKPKTKTISKTVWDWEMINLSKPIWTRKSNEVTKDEYNDFYKSLTKDSSDPLAHTHFVAEGEVTFRGLLYIPKVQPSDSFNRYGTNSGNIKLYVRRVFITDEFNDMMPKFLEFVRGVVDSDDLPLNVSRETLQQHKLIKVIKKKLVRKVLDMISKIDKADYPNFWKEYSTNIKLGVVEDASNRSRLAKLLRFQSSHDAKSLTSLTEYISRMKKTQNNIYYIAGSSRAELEKSPFVERLLAKGFEVLYLNEAVDEYCISALPEFEEKRFQNVAKEGFEIAESEKSKANFEALKVEFAALTKWLSEVPLKDLVSKVQLSERLGKSPCALVASMFGWTGNMERLSLSNAHQKSDDPQRSYYLNQKKTLEINPRHPLIREMLRRVEGDETDEKTKEMAIVMFRTATLRSGYMLQETSEFADSIEKMMRQTLGIPIDEQPQLDDDAEDDSFGGSDSQEKDSAADSDDDDEDNDGHDEL